MPFPTGLQLVSVHGRFDTLPSGGAAGRVRFDCPYTLLGPTDNSIVPPFAEYAALAADGTFTISLPATNDPDWTPVDWAYTVRATVGGVTITGTLQLNYLTTSVELSDLLQVDGAAVAGSTYIPLSYRGAVNGVASLGADGLVPEAQLPVGSGGSGPSPSGTVASGTSFGASSTAGASAAYSRGDHSHGTPALGSSGTTAAAGNHTHAATYQPLDTDLTTIAGLTATTDNMIQSVAGAWASRTPAQVKTALAIAIADVASLQAALDGKVDESVLTTKGDLYVATASATPARLGVGTDTHVLTADSTQATGVKWAAAAGGGSGITPTFVRAYITSGDVTQAADAAWTPVTGLTLSIPAAVGDNVEIALNCMIDFIGSAADFFELVVLVSGSIVRFGSTGTSSPSGSGEGDPSLYPDTDVRFRGCATGMGFTAVSGDRDGSNVVFGLAHKGAGGSKVFASTNYPFRWRARNDKQ